VNKETSVNRTRGFLRLLPVLLLAAGLAGCAGAGLKGAGGMAASSGGAGKADLKDKRVEAEVLADGYVLMDKPDQALANYDKALAQGAAASRINLKKGRLFQSKEVWDQALASYDAVLAEDPASGPALSASGYACLKLGRPEAAEERLSRAAAAQPDRRETRALLAAVYNLRGKPEQALKEGEAALALGEDGEVLNNLGVSAAMLGEFEAASGYFRRAARLAPSARVYNNLAAALCRLGRHDQALDAFAAGSGEAAAYNNVGYFLYQDGQYKRAEEFFEKAMDLSTSYYAKAGENLKRAKLAMGSYPPGQAGAK
jgi:tetratricopeptide (TPR) repeat protein